MTAPVSVSVPAAVSDQPPVVLPDFREQKESRLSGTLRFDSHREWRSLSPQLVSFHFRSVSVRTKTCLLILKTALRWYVQSCSELSFIPQHPPKHHTGAGRGQGRPPPTRRPSPASTPLMSLHIMSPITQTEWLLSPLSLAHFMCAFNALLTCDTADSNPVTEVPQHATARSASTAF